MVEFQNQKNNSSGAKFIKYIKINEFGLGNDFLHMIPKAKATKEKTDKFYFIKIKTSVHQRTQPIE